MNRKQLLNENFKMDVISSIIEIKKEILADLIKLEESMSFIQDKYNMNENLRRDVMSSTVTIRTEILMDQIKLEESISITQDKYNMIDKWEELIDNVNDINDENILDIITVIINTGRNFTTDERIKYIKDILTCKEKISDELKIYLEKHITKDKLEN